MTDMHKVEGNAPIWSLSLGKPEYRLIWWIVQHCDGAGVVGKGWKDRAAADFGTDVMSVTKALWRLEKCGVVLKERYSVTAKLNRHAFDVP